MAARRSLHWGSALRDIKEDRTVRNEVRCEALRTYTKAHPMAAWRGRSGRRYVVTVHAIEAIDASDLRGMVVIGARPDGTIVNAMAHASMPAVAMMARAGANMVHLHSLADTAAERDAIARDLRPLAREVA